MNDEINLTDEEREEIQKVILNNIEDLKELEETEDIELGIKIASNLNMDICNYTAIARKEDDESVSIIFIYGKDDGSCCMPNAINTAMYSNQFDLYIDHDFKLQEMK